MQVVVEQTRVLTAVREQGVKPETPDRIYKLTLMAETECDFETLATLLETVKAMAELKGIPVIQHEAVEQTDKAKAAQFN